MSNIMKIAWDTTEFFIYYSILAYVLYIRIDELKYAGKRTFLRTMKNTLRYNPPEDWSPKKHKYNNHFFGLVKACNWISETLRMKIRTYEEQDFNLLEIGSYKGESTSIFAASGIFEKIFCMDPFEGEEIALDLLDDEWRDVKRNFYTNTRHWDNIHLIQDYSYNQVNNFYDEFFDVIYIDAEHSYESVKKEIELYKPKCKWIIGGHDYGVDEHSGVTDAVNEAFGKPDFTFTDSSWFKILK